MEKRPPMLAADHATVAPFLSLHRDDDGWRLVVPPSAVEKIAKELAAAPGS